MQEVVITDADSRSKYVPLGEGQIDTLLSLAYQVIKLHRETPGALVEDYLSLAIYALDEQATACGIIE